MIRFADAPGPELWEGWEPGALQRAQIEALMESAHGLEIWVQRSSQETPRALVARRQNGGVTVASGRGRRAGEDRELAEFLQVIGYGSVEMDAALSPAFEAVWGRGADGIQTVLGLENGQAPLPPAGPAHLLAPSELYDAAGQAFGLAGEDYPAWLSDFSRRLRRGRALALGLRQGGELLAVGALSHIGSAGAALGYIAVPPAHRGRGYGRRITAALLAAARERGLAPLLACRGELIPFYRPLGFEPVGRQALFFHQD